MPPFLATFFLPPVMCDRIVDRDYASFRELHFSAASGPFVNVLEVPNTMLEVLRIMLELCSLFCLTPF